MAKIFNSSAIQRAVSELFLDQNEKIPSEILDKVQVVYSINNSKSNITSSTTQSTTGTFTIYTPSTTKNFYLTGFTISVNKDATCDQGTGSLALQTVIGGAQRILAYIPVIALTAENHEKTVMFPFPIKIDKGQAISFTGGFTVGVMVRAGVVYGFEDSSN